MPSALGEKIKRLRKQRGLTLEALAKSVDSSKSYMWELENKDVAKPSALIVNSIATTLKVTPDYLVDDTVTNAPKEMGKAQNQAFFRKYENLNDESKEMLNKFLEMLDNNK